MSKHKKTTPMSVTSLAAMAAQRRQYHEKSGNVAQSTPQRAPKVKLCLRHPKLQKLDIEVWVVIHAYHRIQNSRIDL